MLVEACEECLLSNQLFGSFTYQLIVEKILDDDVREPFKIEVCSFMVSINESLVSYLLYINFLKKNLESSMFHFLSCHFARSIGRCLRKHPHGSF